MNKKELLSEIEKETGYSQEVIDVVLESLTTTIGNALIDGEEVDISQFGIFKTKLWKSRRICNVNSGVSSFTHDTRVIRFQPARELKEALK